MKKISSLALALLMVISIFSGMTFTVSADSAVLDITKGSITLTIDGVSGYDSSGNAITGKYDSYVIIGTSIDNNSVTVESGTHDIIISDVVIGCNNQKKNDSNPVYICPITVNSGATVNFTLIGNNKLSSGFEKAGINVPEGATATFSGEGNLTITSTGQYAAAIGGSRGQSSGTITFNSGTYVLNGGYNAACVGGGMSKKSGSTYINGGNITATGGEYGAAFGGGGGDGSGGYLCITNGTVVAIGNKASAGIGGGNGGTGGDVDIFGGNVTVVGGDNAAGIGGSNLRGPGTINISGGIVTVKGGRDSAGIGGGANNGPGGTVNITGGFVKVTAGDQVNKDTAPEAIGRGGFNYSSENPRSSGTRTFSPSASIYAGATEAEASYTTAYNGEKYIYVVFNKFDVADAPLYISSTGFKRSADGEEVPYTGEYLITGKSGTNEVAASGESNLILKDLSVPSITLEDAAITIEGKCEVNDFSFDTATIDCSKALFTSQIIIGGNLTINSGTITTDKLDCLDVIAKDCSIKAANIDVDTFTDGVNNLALEVVENAVLGNATRLYTATVEDYDFTYTGCGHGNGDTNLYLYLPADYKKVTVQRVGEYAKKLDVSMLQFTNGTDVITAFKTTDTVTSGVELFNDTGVAQSAIYIAAVYNGENELVNVLVDVPDGDVVADGDTITLSATLNMAEYPDAEIIKTFVWNGAQSIAPLTEKSYTLPLYKQRDFTFGTLQNNTSHLQANMDAGMNTALLELNWSQFYSADGVKNTQYIADAKNKLKTMKDMGYKVMLGLGTQYSPSWIYNYPNSRYVNQYGDAYSTTESGDTAVNAVFNNKIRGKLEEYVLDVFEELGTDFDIIRLGWMRYGEIGFPNQNFNGNSNSWWGFDDIAQGKVTGLPEGVPVRPVVGWKPGDASPNGEAKAFANWYMDALLNYQNWQVDLISKYSDAELAILYPSWGMREGQLDNAIKVNLNGSTGPEKNGEVQRGFDFARLISGITNPKAIVYCTWIDANPDWTNGDDQERPTTSNNFSPVHYMAYYAKQHPLKLKIMGENTGGGGMSAMNLTFERMKKYNLDGLMWAFENDLYDGSAPVLSDYESAIADYIATMDKE